MRKRHDQVYGVWAQMIQRCTNPKHRQWKDYGGRGITVCERWKNAKNFISDMGPRAPGLTLERKNNHLGYNPENCCWATRKVQNSNKRNCLYLVVDAGEKITLAEFCRRRKIPYRPMVKRINERGWPLELAVSLPVGTRKDTELMAILWERIAELKDYLGVMVQGAEGGFVLPSLIEEAKMLCDTDSVRLA